MHMDRSRFSKAVDVSVELLPGWDVNVTSLLSWLPVV